MNVEVVRSKRKTMAIQVFRDQKIQVRVPLRCKNSDVVAFIDKYQAWINVKLDEAKRYPGLAESNYTDGGSLWLLGEPISIVVKSGNTNNLIYHEDRIIISQTDNKDTDKTYRLINNWKRKYAMDLFQQRSRFWFEQFPVALKGYQLRLRKMKRQWGNCNQRGVITINSQLIRYPMVCIDYVIVHELTHLKYLNHGNKFYRLLESVMPEWHQSKLQLSQFSGSKSTGE